VSTNETLTREVFVAGGNPDITYVPRSTLNFEVDLREYLSQSGKALCVSGPTKCGKTVLVRRVLPESKAVWINGNDLSTVEVMWRKVVDYLGLYDQVEIQLQQGKQHTITTSGGVGVPLVNFGGGYATGTSGSQQTACQGSEPNRM
jgi:hypothetical protein